MNDGEENILDLWLTAAEEYDLAMHLIAVHGNAAAVHNTVADNIECHHHEHFGPGGIRNHEYTRYFYRLDEVEAVLEEAETEP